MEYLLVFVVTFSLAISFFCSISEAALFAIPVTHVKAMSESGGRAAKILAEFKDEMGKPISAILILNTIANVTGPSVGGAAIESIMGPSGIVYFAVLMSMAMLVLGEIIPKFLGVSYSKRVALLTAIPLAAFVRFFRPLIWISKLIIARIEPEEEIASFSHEEVLSMAAIGAEEGALDHLEGSVIKNVIRLDKLLVRDILTPRVMVFRVEDTTTLAQAETEILDWNFSRVPTFNAEEPDLLNGYVRQRDIYRELLRGNKDITLKDLARPIKTVPELMRADKLLLHLFEEREHICSVVDEHGALAGIVTLEDVLEEVVGREIVDEYDVVR